MLTHDKVVSEVQFLEWQITAWNKVKNCYDASYAHIQITYLQDRIKALKEWDAEVWNS